MKKNKLSEAAITLRVRKELLERIDKICEQKMLSRSALIRQAIIERFLKKPSQESITEDEKVVDVLKENQP